MTTTKNTYSDPEDDLFPKETYSFSEKSLLALGEYYVYGLIDPRNRQIFYVGKGSGQRVFEHERESYSSPDSEKLKLKTIAEIRNAGLGVEKVIFNWNLTEAEAFAAEAALINALNYVTDAGLTNIVSGHHSSEALSADEFEKTNGAVELQDSDIKHKIMVIKINKLYHRGMPEDALYNSVRGIWKASLKRAKTIDYVFGVYNSLIVAVYKPTKWFVCKDAKEYLPRQDIELTEKTKNRIFFVDEEFENNKPIDDVKSFYLFKSIAGLRVNQSAQNPITYLDPFSERPSISVKRRSKSKDDYRKYADLAKEWYPNFDRVDELEDAFVFTDTSYKQDGCVVVMKETGECLTMSGYVIRRANED